MQNKSTVLIAENDAEISNSISLTLTENGYRPLTAENGNTAISMITSHCPDIALLDQALPDMEGLGRSENRPRMDPPAHHYFVFPRE